MLRLKLLLPVFLLVALAAATFFVRWMPQHQAQEHERFKTYQQSQLQVVSVALVEPILRGDLGQIQNTLDEILLTHPHWLNLSLTDPAGRPLYMQNEAEPSLKEADLVNLQHSVRNYDTVLATLGVTANMQPLHETEAELTQEMIWLVATFLLLAVLVTVPLMHAFVQRPMTRLAKAATALAEGDFEAELPRASNDEIGHLASSFAEMRDRIRAYQQNLTTALQAEQATALQLSRRNTLLAAIEEVQGQFIAEKDRGEIFQHLLQHALTLTQSEYGFIGAAKRDDEGRPYLQTVVLSNIAWDEETRALYAATLGSGIEFRAPKTLIGAVLETGQPVIANDPANDSRSGGTPPGHPAIKAFLGLPLFGSQGMVGMLGVANRQGGYDTGLVQELAPFLQAVGNLFDAHAQELQRCALSAAARESESRFRAVFEEAGIGISLLDLGGNVVMSNPALQQMLGYSSEELVGLRSTDFTHPDDAIREQALRAALFAGECASYQMDKRYIRKDGSVLWGQLAASLVRDDQGQPLYSVKMVKDITEQKQAEEKLRLSAAVFESGSEAITITDTNVRIVAVNQAFTEMSGYSEAEVLGKSPSLLKSGQHDRDFYAQMWQSIRDTGRWRGEIFNKRKNGGIFPLLMNISAVRDKSGAVTNYVSMASEISQIKEFQERLEFLAHYDTVTGLPNRLLLEMRLERALSWAGQQGHQVAVLFIDLDRFKNVNDSLGHPVGDRLLQEVGKRLSKRLRQEDTLARLGGDEFVVLLEELHGAEGVFSIARKLISAFEQPFLVDGHELMLTASLGISLYPDDGEDVATLLRNADTAMYRAKENGRNGFHVYTSELTQLVADRLDLEKGLRQALKKGQLELHYQPQLSFTTGEVVGAEALIRWRHPKRGMVRPDHFIPLAEDSGLIIPIGEWVLHTACAQARAWQEAGLPFGRVAVNLSAIQVQHRRIVETVQRALEENGLSPASLELEVTESFIMQNAERAIGVLEELKGLGVQIAIDDFGTGYSSLSYLQRLPVHKLKIDKSFVQRIGGNEDGSVIARTVIALGKNLRLAVIAEGVETQDQHAFLQSEGCDESQGYLHSRPLPPEEFASWLMETRRTS